MHKKSRKGIHQLTVRQFEALFPSDDACKAYLLNHRWPYGVRCPRCGHEKVYELPARPWHWQCHKCAPHGYRFSILVGTVFENTNYPIRDWFRVIHTMLTSKKGVSALQIYRTMGMGSYRTAWYMCHRIRAGLQDEHFRKLMGIVEVDETYVGGTTKNKHWDDRGPDGGRGTAGKTPIAGAVSRKGKVVARVIAAADGPTLTAFVCETVSHKAGRCVNCVKLASSLLATDDKHAYRRLNRRYLHAVVKHTRGEYVHGAVHTQTIDGFWSLIKRGIVGTFHKVSRKYLPLYVAEFQFRYNNRENPDIVGAAIKGC